MKSLLIAVFTFTVFVNTNAQTKSTNVEDTKKTNEITKDEDRKVKKNLTNKYIYEISYDFQSKKIDTGLPKNDYRDAMFFDLHEHDGIRIRIKNINPFIYSVTLFESQNDQINSEVLSEINQISTLRLNIEKIQPLAIASINLKRNENISTAISTKEKAVQKLKEVFIINDQNVIQVDQDQKSQLDKIEELRKDVLNKIFEEEEKALRENDTNNKINQLEGVLRGYLNELTENTNRMNNFIRVHNQLISIVTSPINDHNEIERSAKKLLTNLLVVDNIDDVHLRYWNELTKVNILNNKISENILSLESLSPGKYSNIRIEFEIFKNNLSNMNHDKLLNNIESIFRLITQENFELVYETQFVNENVDVLEYKIQFKPIEGFSIPKAPSAFNLNMKFHIVNGVKIDISPSIIIDYGLADPSYYFEKSEDNATEMVTVRKSNTSSNYTPSVSALLNVYKRTSSNFKFIGWSLGFGVSTKLRFRLYTGPTLIVGRKERVVISAGLAMGIMERLQDGYTLNQPFALSHSDVPTVVPVVADRFSFGRYIAIGFNLFGQQNKSFFDKVKFD